MVNKRVRNAVLGCNLKNDRMISVHLQGKPFNIAVIQVYAPRILKEIIFSSSFLWILKDIVTTLSKNVFFGVCVTIVLQPRFKPTRPKFSTQLGTENKGRLVPAWIVPLGSRGLSLISPRLLITGRSPGHKGTSVHFPILCQ